MLPSEASKGLQNAFSAMLSVFISSLFSQLEGLSYLGPGVSLFVVEFPKNLLRIVCWPTVACSSPEMLSDPAELDASNIRIP